MEKVSKVKVKSFSMVLAIFKGHLILRMVTVT